MQGRHAHIGARLKSTVDREILTVCLLGQHRVVVTVICDNCTLSRPNQRIADIVAEDDIGPIVIVAAESAITSPRPLLPKSFLWMPIVAPPRIRSDIATSKLWISLRLSLKLPSNALRHAESPTVGSTYTAAE